MFFIVYRNFCAVISTTCIFVRYHQNKKNKNWEKSEAPEWPPYFISEWMMLDNQIETGGPSWDLYPPLPFRAGYGWTYYNWETQNISEIYENFCLNIFEHRPHWRCNFLNAKNKSYLISLDKSSSYPDFTSNLPYNSTSIPSNTNTIDFYCYFDDDFVHAFGYGFSRDIVNL